jgi:hypothetical protein
MDSEDRREVSDRELLVRIDTKLAVVIAVKEDHEERLRSVEGKLPHFVTGKQLWIGLLGVASVTGAAFPVIQWVINK